MNSRQIMKKALKGCDRNFVAETMGIQVGSLNNQVAGELPYHPKGKTKDFIDRVMSFIDATNAETGQQVLLEWMAEEFGCILINNPMISAASSPAISKISEILRDFAAVIDEISKAAADTRIEQHEAEKIRAKWEIMKRITEEFVLACETGVYDKTSNQ